MALVTKVRVLDEGVSITQGVKEMDEMDDDTGSDYGSGSGSDSYGSYSENDSSSQIELYSEAEIAMRTFRFSVGDPVRCCIDGQPRADGVVIRRCYREPEWPRGYYAAYQVRLHADVNGDSCLIYAPRDEDCYIMSGKPPPPRFNVAELGRNRRLSRQRKLIRQIEATLNDNTAGDAPKDDSKVVLCEKLRRRHKDAMCSIIADVRRDFAAAAV